MVSCRIPQCGPRIISRERQMAPRLICCLLVDEVVEFLQMNFGPICAPPSNLSLRKRGQRVR